MHIKIVIDNKDDMRRSIEANLAAMKSGSLGVTELMKEVARFGMSTQVREKSEVVADMMKALADIAKET